VKELENVIKKRFPNSLSALILSSGVAEGQSKQRYVLGIALSLGSLIFLMCNNESVGIGPI
jgi:hypothetical protein